jgi:hypothetical protein
MTGIGDVVGHLKVGGAARRAGWNGKGMAIYLERSDFVTGGFEHSEFHEPVVVLVTPRGTRQRGWVCSQEDLLAEDWELLSFGSIMSPGQHSAIPRTEAQEVAGPQ